MPLALQMGIKILLKFAKLDVIRFQRKMQKESELNLKKSESEFEKIYKLFFSNSDLFLLFIYSN